MNTLRVVVHPQNPLRPGGLAIGVALGDPEEHLVVEEDVPKVHPLIRLIDERVVTALFVKEPARAVASHCDV